MKIVSYAITELALCFHSSPGRFTALRGFAFLGFSFSFHLLTETFRRFVWFCTQGRSICLLLDQSKTHFTFSHECAFFLLEGAGGFKTRSTAKLIEKLALLGS